MKPIFFARSALVALLVFAGSAFAQAAEPVSPLTMNISLTSNYKFRGQDQDQSKSRALKPALNGGLDYASSNGFYLGNWNSTIDWTKQNFGNAQDSGVEVDVYGGYKFKAGDVDMDIGSLAYLYPGASGVNTTEVYVGAGFGPLVAKYSHTVSKGYFGIGRLVGPAGDGRGTGYFSLAFAQEIMPQTTFKASMGFTNWKDAINKAGLPDYVDYSVGAAYDLGDGFTLNGAVTGANKKDSYVFSVDPGKSVNKATLVVTLSKAL